MLVEITYKDNIKIIKVNGEVDFENYSLFKDSILENIQGTQKVILNLENLDYINSMGLSTIVTAYSNTKKENRMLVMCCLNSNISKLFRITKLDKVINIFSTLEESVEFLVEN